MYVESVPNRSSPPAVLLRESYRDRGRVKKRTLANLSKLPAAAVEAVRRVLRGERLVAPEEAFTCVRSLPHGHIAAVLGVLKQLELDTLIARGGSRVRDLVMALIVARVIDPVDDWGKLLGDTAAVTALLDRLLHHAHVLKCGPRSWRTKVQISAGGSKSIDGLRHG